MVSTFLATLFLELEFAIFLGVMLSLALYINRTSRPRVLPRTPDPKKPKRKFTTDSSLPVCPQLQIIRIDGSLFFGAVSHVQEEIMKLREQHPGQKHLAIVASGINFIDVAGAEFLEQEAKKRRAEGGGLYLIHVKPGLCEPFKRGGYLESIGDENIYPTKTVALRCIFDKLDESVCCSCTARIFNECQSVPLPEPELELAPA